MFWGEDICARNHLNARTNKKPKLRAAPKLSVLAPNLYELSVIQGYLVSVHRYDMVQFAMHCLGLKFEQNSTIITCRTLIA